MTVRRSIGRNRLRIVNTTVLAVAAVYFLFPLVWLSTAATKSEGSLVKSSALGFGSDLIDNLVLLFTRTDGIFARWMFNGIFYAGVGAAIGTLLSAMAGYTFAKYRFRGKESIFGFILVGVLVPQTVLALPLFLLLSSVGLTNTIWSVLLPSVVSPFGVYLARIYSASAVPDDLIEAARIDGAGDLRIFRSMSVRLMWPGLVTLFLFQFAAIWNNFLLPLVMLSNNALYPATLGLYNWNGLYIQDPTLIPSVITGSFVAVFPIIVVFLVLERYMRSGLAAGSVKG